MSRLFKFNISLPYKNFVKIKLILLFTCNLNEFKFV